MMDFLHTLFSSDRFMPHGHCYLWDPGLLSLHIISDALITAAYFSIPFTLIYFVRKRRDLEFNWMFLCFAVFIVACGATHLMEIWVIWHPAYWLSGGVKAITALASLPTAVLLVRLVPEAVRLPSPAVLRSANAALAAEIVERGTAEKQVRRLNEELEQRVRDRVAQLEAVNEALQKEVAERRRVEAALRENQHLLQAISDNAPAVIYAKDLAGRYLMVNRRYTKIFHVDAETALGKTDYDIFRKENADTFRAMDERVAAGGVALTEEEIVPQDDGPHTYISVKCPLRDGDGKLYAVCGISTDVTEHQAAEKELEVSLKEISDLKAAVDAHAIVAITDPQGKITYVNEKFCAISKYSRAELIGQDHRIINSGHHPKAFIRDLWMTITHGEVWHGEIKNKAKDGTFYWVDTTIVPFLDERGKPRQYVAIRADITARKRAEEAREGLAAIVECSDDAIIAKTLEGVITSWNRGAERIFGYTAAEAVGKSALLVFPPDRLAEESEILSRVTRGESVDHFETVRIKKGGQPIYVSETISPLKDSDGKIIGASNIARDISAQKQAEEEVRRLNFALEQRVVERTAELEMANRELEAFSYSVSHDLRAPLRSVDGFSQAVLEDFGPLLPDKGQHYLHTIRQSAQRMGALIDDLLEFSRLGRRALITQEVDMGELVRTALHELGSPWPERRIELRVPELPACRGDRALLRQVWTNLLANALKYTRKRERALIEIGVKRDNNGEDIFFVRDNGTGFDMRYADKLFGVFQRLHRAEDYEGTGVGLAIVQRIVNRHGGRAWAEAEVDRGATFYFTLKTEDLS